MEKELLKSKKEFDCFVSGHTGYDSYHGNVVSWLDEPEKYPCIVMYDIEYNENGPDYLIGDFVYPDDFDDK